MEVVVGILAFLVAVVTVLQGFSIYRNRKPGNPISGQLNIIITELGNTSTQLSEISGQLGRMEQRLNDCWNKLNQ